jgi:hypothetical protein
MNPSLFATVLGLAFLVTAVAGFFPSPPPVDAPALEIEHGHGMLLGLFPVNTIHNIIHLAFGLLGLAAGRGLGMTGRGYAQFIAVAYGLLTVLGLMPATYTTFGLAPIWGNDVWLHGAIALASAVVGFGGRR